MIISKVFEVTIYVNNPINFCINKTQYILTELNNIYLHKCFMGSFILKILDILQSSSCKIIASNSSGHGVIDVRFVAEVYILNTWDIVIGVEIKKNQSLLIGLYKKNELEIDITLKPTNIQANLINIDQLIPVRIVKAIHMPKQSQISAAAILLTCDKKSIVYKVKGEINKQLNPEIKYFQTKIIEELKLRNELMVLNKDRVLFFESLLYSYKNNTKDVEKIRTMFDITYECYGFNKKGMNVKDIFQVINSSTPISGYWSRPLSIYRSSPYISLLTDKVTDYILSTPNLMIIDLLKNILSNLMAIRELVETYNSNELIQSHENIWNIMRQNQI